jgi:hypothetical protein
MRTAGASRALRAPVLSITREEHSGPSYAEARRRPRSCRVGVRARKFNRHGRARLHLRWVDRARSTKSDSGAGGEICESAGREASGLDSIRRRPNEQRHGAKTIAALQWRTDAGVAHQEMKAKPSIDFSGTGSATSKRRKLRLSDGECAAAQSLLRWVGDEVRIAVVDVGVTFPDLFAESFRSPDFNCESLSPVMPLQFPSSPQPCIRDRHNNGF